MICVAIASDFAYLRSLYDVARSHIVRVHRAIHEGQYHNDQRALALGRG